MNGSKTRQGYVRVSANGKKTKVKPLFVVEGKKDTEERKSNEQDKKQ